MEEQSSHLETGGHLFILAEFKTGPSGRPLGGAAPVFPSHSLVSFSLWRISEISLIRLAELNLKHFSQGTERKSFFDGKEEDRQFFQASLRLAWM